jgi:CDP-paratose synthetase
MKILITGATGAVGTKLIPYLLNKGKHYILTINRNIDKAEHLFPSSNFISHTTIFNKEDIEHFKPEIILHLASYVTSSDELHEGKKLIESNILFGLELLYTLEKINSVKLFLNFGTFAEFRLGGDKINNTYLYSASKTAFRSFVEYYSNKNNFKLIHIIPYTIYGTSDEKKKIFDYIYDGFISEEPIKMSPGHQQLDFIHIDDVCNCIYTIMYSPINYKFHNQNIHLGTGKAQSIQEVANIMGEILNKPSKHIWGGIPYRKQEVMFACANINSLIELGCMPMINIRTGIELFIEEKSSMIS